MPQTLDNAINSGLERIQDERSQARKFHAETIGKDVDPSRCFGDFLVSIAKASDPRDREHWEARERLEKVYHSSRTKAALSVSQSGATGGYLVPQEFSTQLMQDVSEESIFRQLSLVVPMTSAVLLLPLPDAETVQAAGKSPFFGGIQMVWGEEAALLPETEPTWRQVELRANELTGYAVSSIPLLQDGGRPFESYLRRLFARATAWYEDYAYLRGNGVSQPLGIFNSGAAIKVTRQTGNTITQQDTTSMLGNLLPYSYPNAMWAVSVTAITKLTTITGYVPNEGERSEGRAIGALYGRPVFPSEKLPAVGTLGDLVLFDPSLYVIGDREAIDIAASAHVPTPFQKYQITWRIIQRVDGRPWFDQKITLQDTSTTVSPIVLLN